MNKYQAELDFQKIWVKEFIENKDNVLEYWNTFRYLNEIKSLININEKSRILDVGSGISTVLHFLEGTRVAVDPLMSEYRKIYKYPDEIHNWELRGEDLCERFSRNAFDVVFCSNVLDHSDSPEKVLSEIHNVLRRGGYFILTVELFEYKIKRDAAHTHCLHRDEVISMIDDKFSVVFEKHSPWIGLRRYVNGQMECDNKELILVLKKEK